MALGKEEFRTKYKESNDCLEKIKDNYYDLDYEYQMIAKELQQKENIIKEVREKINTLYNTFMYDEDYRYDEDGSSILEIKEILDKVEENK